MDESNIYLGLDIGGTKIALRALNSVGEELYVARTSTPIHDYAFFLDTITHLVHEADTHLNSKGTIAISIAGAVSMQTGCIKNSGVLCANGQPLGVDLKERLKRNIAIENDGNCLTLSEAID